MLELKPCPFCGSKVKVACHSSFFTEPVYMIVCKGCDMLLSNKGKDTKKHLIEAWNKRVPQTVVNQNGENCTNITNCGTLNFSL